MIRSIRMSLVVGTTLATLAVLLVAGGYAYFGVRGALLEQFDNALQQDAEALALNTDVYPSGVKIDFEPLDMRDFAAPSGFAFFQIWIDGTDVVYRSESLQDLSLLRFGGALETPEFRVLPLAGQGKVRAVGVSFTPTAEEEDAELLEAEPDPLQKLILVDRDLRGSTATLVLARRADSIDAVLARIKVLLVGLGLIASAVAVAILWIVIRKNLSPLESLARRISELRAANGSARVDLPRVPTEIQPVVDRLNELLERIDAAIQRERSFSAHVAHELRTPVAALRSTMEVARTRPRDAEEYRSTIAECLAIVQQLQDMVETLLYLFRLESGQVEAKTDEVDLRQLVLDSWAQLREAAEARKLRAQCELPSPVVVSTDGGLLSLAIRNILENAVVHSDEGGVVRVGVHRANGRVDFDVSNTCTEVAHESVPMMFERFWRGDPARSSDGVHSGLGLSVVKKVADVLGCALAVKSDSGEFRITLSLKSRSLIRAET